MVRFHCGDKYEQGYYLADGEINYWLTEKTTVGGAVVACIQHIIALLSQPNFKLDWMSVSNEEARKGFENLLKEKAQEFGISLFNVSGTATISSGYRADSNKTDEDYTGTGASTRA